jgi:hypothetical protein
MYVVYAPEDRAYPAELQYYPSETEGYKDQYGVFVSYLAERPELPASLPYHGRPPAQPYDSVSVVHFYSSITWLMGLSLSSTVIMEEHGRDSLLIVVVSVWWGTKAYVQQIYYIV